MDVVHPRCAGLDVSKRDAKACVRIQGSGRRRASSTVSTWRSFQTIGGHPNARSRPITKRLVRSTGSAWAAEGMLPYMSN